MNMQNKKQFLFVAILLAALSAVPAVFASGAAEKGSGSIENIILNHKDFDAVTISGIDQFEIRLGEGYAVSLSGDDNILRKVQVEQRGETLSLILSEAHKFTPTTLKAVVEIPSLDKLIVEARSKGVLMGRAHTGNLDIIVTSGASLELHDLRVDKSLVKVSASGMVSGYLHADDLALQVNSAGAVLEGGEADYLSVFASNAYVEINDFFINGASLDFRNGSSGAVYMKDASLDRTASTTRVTLRDESSLTLVTEGNISDDIEADSYLY